MSSKVVELTSLLLAPNLIGSPEALKYASDLRGSEQKEEAALGLQQREQQIQAKKFAGRPAHIAKSAEKQAALTARMKTRGGQPSGPQGPVDRGAEAAALKGAERRKRNVASPLGLTGGVPAQKKTLLGG